MALQSETIQSVDAFGSPFAGARNLVIASLLPFALKGLKGLSFDDHAEYGDFPKIPLSYLCGLLHCYRKTNSMAELTETIDICNHGLTLVPRLSNGEWFEMENLERIFGKDFKTRELHKTRDMLSKFNMALQWVKTGLDEDFSSDFQNSGTFSITRESLTNAQNAIEKSETVDFPKLLALVQPEMPDLDLKLFILPARALTGPKL